MPTAEEAAAANALYRAMSGLPADTVNTQITSTPQGQAYQAQINAADAAAEQAKHDVAFSQPRNDLAVTQSAAFNAINSAYQQQKSMSIGSSGQMSQTPGAQAEFSRQPGYVVNTGIDTGRAALQNFGAPLQVSRYSQELENQPSRSTVPIRDLSSGMSDVLFSSLPGAGTVTAYTPYGDRAQTELQKVKIGYGETGEVGFYQQPYGHSILNLASSGGRNALQSGMFTVNEPATPVVYTQESAGTTFSKTANIPEALKVIASPDYYSRLGAEVYGGFVKPLTGATVESTGAQLSTYANPNNLANLVSPQAVNMSKGELPGANIPWSVPSSAPAIASFETILLPVPFTSVGKSVVGAPLSIEGPTPSVGSNPLEVAATSLFAGKLPEVGALWASTPVAKIINNWSWESRPLEETTKNIAATTSRGTEGLLNTAAILPFVGAEAAGARSAIGAAPVIGSILFGTGVGAALRSPEKIPESLQTGMRTAFSTGPLLPLAFVSDSALGVASGKKENLPLYDFITGLSPYKQKVGTVTSEQYDTNLRSYNTDLSKYETNKALFEKGGSLDTTLFGQLQTDYSSLQSKQKQLESQQKNIENPPTPWDNIGKSYEALNTGLAPYTTDIAGIGKTLVKIPDVDLRKYGDTSGINYGDIPNVAKGTYIGASQNPLDIALTYGGGNLLGLGEGVVKNVVARSAMSELPVIGTFGRAASTPLAADVVGIGKGLLGAYIIAESGINILSQPTATLKGEALGRTGIQFGGFGAGMQKGGISSLEETPNRFSNMLGKYNEFVNTEPMNTYSGKGFFSGKPEFGPIEKAQFKLETASRSLFAAEPGAYREVASIALPVRLIEPSIRAEPNFNILKTSGKYGPEIRSTLMEQPHSVVGSSSLIQQYPKSIAESTGLRIGKDVDVLLESPNKAIASLVGRTKGLTTESAKGFLDVHPIPANYPGFKPSAQAEKVASESGLFTKVFGDPYRNIAFPRSASEIIKPGAGGYGGKITYEGAQVQMGRKSSAVALVMQKPMQYGYRAEKDIYDFITEYAAQKAVALSRGVPEKQFASSDIAMTNFMGRSLTYGTVKGAKAGEVNPTVTKTVGDIYKNLFSENKLAQAKVKAGEELPGNIEIGSYRKLPEVGITSSIGKGSPLAVVSLLSSPSIGSVKLPSSTSPSPSGNNKIVISSDVTSKSSRFMSPSILSDLPSIGISKMIKSDASSVPSVSKGSSPSTSPSPSRSILGSILPSILPSVGLRSISSPTPSPSIKPAPSFTIGSLPNFPSLPSPSPSRGPSSPNPPSPLTPSKTPPPPTTKIPRPFPMPSFGGGTDGAAPARGSKRYREIFDYNYDVTGAAKATSKLLKKGSNIGTGSVSLGGMGAPVKYKPAFNLPAAGLPKSLKLGSSAPKKKGKKK